MLYYTAKVTKEEDESELFPNGVYCIEVPQLPGCNTFTESFEDIYATTHECVLGWLLSNLDTEASIFPLNAQGVKDFIPDKIVFNAVGCCFFPVVMTEEDMREIRHEALQYDRSTWI